jgi:hypothetical protein
MIETIENKTEQAEVVAVEKPYTFRPLQAEDTFLMCKIIKAIGIKEFKACFEEGGIQEMLAQFMGGNQEENNEAAVVKAGVAVFIDIADVILGNLPKCENEIFRMLANTSGMSEQAIRKMGFADFFEMVIDFIKKEEFRDFIKVVSRLF